MEIKIFMVVSDGNYNIFDLVSNSIRMYPINIGLSILGAIYIFKKLKENKL